MAATQECPHCYTRMIPMADGTCPSCQLNIADPGNGNPDLAMVVVTQRQAMPRYCLVCGQTTDRIQTIQAGAESEVASNVAISLAGILLALVTGFGFIRTGSGAGPRVAVRVPVCPRCTKDDRLKPRHVDFHHYQMRFLAHRRFKEALVDMRRQ